VSQYHPRATAFVLASLALLLAMDSRPAFAQGRARTSSIERRIEDMTRQREQFERDTMSKEVKPGARVDRVRPTATTAQVSQDFEGIQVVYNEIVRALASTEGLDYRFIESATADIKRLASRLQNNLVLPQPEPAAGDKDPQQPAEIGEGQLKSSLVKLCKHIVSFVTSPLFESSAVLDVEHSKKASADLSRIIRLSDDINRCVDSLHKSPGPRVK
jgi:hypothetical protein